MCTTAAHRRAHTHISTASRTIDVGGSIERNPEGEDEGALMDLASTLKAREGWRAGQLRRKMLTLHRATTWTTRSGPSQKSAWHVGGGIVDVETLQGTSNGWKTKRASTEADPSNATLAHYVARLFVTLRTHTIVHTTPQNRATSTSDLISAKLTLRFDDRDGG